MREKSGRIWGTVSHTFIQVKGVSRMTHGSSTLELESRVSTPAKPEIQPLEKVVESILEDSQLSPQDYLDETEVPHGGE